MEKSKKQLDPAMLERHQNMVASCRIEGIEMDDAAREEINLVLTGQLTPAELEKRILAEYLGSGASTPEFHQAESLTRFIERSPLFGLEAFDLPRDQSLTRS
jgi:hypothetical protein